MPQGDKSAYSDKQKRKAEHIEQGYEKRGVSKDEAERRAGDREQAGGRRKGKRLGAEEQPVGRGEERLGDAAQAGCRERLTTRSGPEPGHC